LADSTTAIAGGGFVAGYAGTTRGGDDHQSAYHDSDPCAHHILLDGELLTAKT
jgi:hypothetical protein